METLLYKLTVIIADTVYRYSIYIRNAAKTVHKVYNNTFKHVYYTKWTKSRIEKLDNSVECSSTEEEEVENLRETGRPTRT